MSLRVFVVVRISFWQLSLGDLQVKYRRHLLQLHLLVDLSASDLEHLDAIYHVENSSLLLHLVSQQFFFGTFVGQGSERSALLIKEIAVAKIVFVFERLEADERAAFLQLEAWLWLLNRGLVVRRHHRHSIFQQGAVIAVAEV